MADAENRDQGRGDGDEDEEEDIDDTVREKAHQAYQC
jgi:hypothetical protein